MKESEAILAFSQSEKIKSGIIWVSQMVEMQQGLEEKYRPGTDNLLEAMVGMIGHEVHITGNVTEDFRWQEAEKSINMALVMIRSKVSQESTFHLTNALAQITGLGNQAMNFLKEKGLL